MKTDLTPRQKSVLEYIISFQQEHRMAPTVREICAHLGLSGPAGIHRILNILKDKGYILAGDVAIIRPQQRVENGEIAAVMVQDLLPEATLKIVRHSRSALTLEPANAAYSPLAFKGPRRKQVVVLGKYIGIVRKA